MAKTKHHYYRVREGKPDPEGRPTFQITKLNADFDHEATYAIYPTFNGITCNCPSRKRPCKHIAILHKFQDVEKVGGPEVYNPETGCFVRLDNV